MVMTKERWQRLRFFLTRTSNGQAVGCCLVLFSLLLFPAVRAIALQASLPFLHALPRSEINGRTNILLLGTGDKNHDGADLTDAILVASIDPLTRSVVMFSLPRDLYLTDDRFAAGRINRLYAVHKGQLMLSRAPKASLDRTALALTADDIGLMLGIPIHGAIKVDFTAAEELIDAVGGVTVDVPETVVDYAYPIREGVVGTFSIKKGIQHLDGATALKYARTRHSSSDFDRSARQQILLSALKSRLAHLTPLGMLAAASKTSSVLSEHVVTTLSTRQLFGITALASQMRSDRLLKFQIQSGGDSAGGFLLAGDPALYEGAAVLLPWEPGKSGESFGGIARFAQLVINQREMYLEHPVIIVETAPLLSAELTRYGFPTKRPPKRAEPIAPTHSAIVCAHLCPMQTLRFLSRTLDLPIETHFAASSGATILLTKDYRYQPFSTLLP